MGLECPNGTFGFVASVHVRGDKLEGPAVVANGLLHCLAGLVVEDLPVHCESPGFEAGDEGVVGWDAVVVGL